MEASNEVSCFGAAAKHASKRCLRGEKLVSSKEYCSAQDATGVHGAASKQCQESAASVCYECGEETEGSTTSPSYHSGSDEGESTSGEGNSKREQQENSIQVCKAVSEPRRNREETAAAGSSYSSREGYLETVSNWNLEAITLQQLEKLGSILENSNMERLKETRKALFEQQELIKSTINKLEKSNSATIHKNVETATMEYLRSCCYEEVKKSSGSGMSIRPGERNEKYQGKRSSAASSEDPKETIVLCPRENMSVRSSQLHPLPTTHMANGYVISVKSLLYKVSGGIVKRVSMTAAHRVERRQA